MHTYTHALPYMGDSISVFIACRPDSYFVPFSSDVDHSTTNVFAVVIKGLSNQAQQLKVHNNKTTTKQQNVKHNSTDNCPTIHHLKKNDVLWIP